MVMAMGTAMAMGTDTGTAMDTMKMTNPNVDG